MIRRNPRPGSRVRSPDLSALEGLVSPEVLKAARVASDAFKKAGVRHLIVGGLAVGVHGYPRTTKDVDFLVGEEAFDQQKSGLVTVKAAIPIYVGDVPIDHLSAVGDDAFLEDALSIEGGIAPVEVLVYLKLKTFRRRDRHDIITLIQEGIDTDVVIEYLDENDTGLVERFEGLIEVAEREE